MVKFGLLLHPDRGVDAVYQEAELADQQGFDSIWLGDHIAADGRVRALESAKPDQPLDSLTLMTGIGARTSRVRLAWSMLNVSFRYPAMLAKVLATLDQMTKGRVICSLGSGSTPGEHKAYNIPVADDHDQRIAYARELVLLLKELWTHPAPEQVSFAGTMIQTYNLPFAPAPFQKPYPPIWLGGASDATLDMVKELADGWVMLTTASEDRLQEVLSQTDWPTRPMTIVRQVRMFVAEDRDTAVGEARASFERNPVGMGGKAADLDAFINREVVGTRDDCLRRIEELEATGSNYLRLTCDTPAQQERVAELILPRLK